VLPFELALQLREAGLAWKPVAGDRFGIPDRGLDDEVFVLSHMTIEVHQLPDGPVIGFNGTVEWALDDVAQDEAVWLPREDQLRELLGAGFRRLERLGDRYRVVVDDEVSEAGSAEETYAKALLRSMEHRG
jgi:hypothetical protein